jgi:hypothetical protein
MDNNDLINSFVEITLKEKDDFLKVRETLTRIGIASKKEQKLFQSCHILHKQGKYFIVHFKEMFLLDRKPSTFSEEDKARRNTIANLLSDWSLVTLVDPDKSKAPVVNTNNIKILPFNEKPNWECVAKYCIGGKRKPQSV